MNTFSFLQRFLREPLFHFILIGGLFFLIYSNVNKLGSDSPDTIRVTKTRISQLATEFKGVWNRVPTAKELDHLIEEEVRSEVYYRDALALGLDKNDTIMRRRLRQKMEFLTDTSIYLQEPATDELADYFAAHKQVYQGEPLLAFEQVYLGNSPSREKVLQTLARLQATPAPDISTLGEHSRLPSQLRLSGPGAINSIFGKGFYTRAANLIPGKWDGPVRSAYGIHLVRTLDGSPGRTPSLQEIRDAVVKDWKTAKAKENREADYTKRKSRYHVEILRNNDESRAIAAKGRN